MPILFSHCEKQALCKAAVLTWHPELIWPHVLLSRSRASATPMHMLILLYTEFKTELAKKKKKKINCEAMKIFVSTP